jgi:hypothetical protein
MKKFYLFTERGITDRYFCGNIYEASPDDTIRYNREVVTFDFCEAVGVCMAFDTRKEANQYSLSQQAVMEDENVYARRAEECEEYYGCEGVDDMRYEN